MAYGKDKQMTAKWIGSILILTACAYFGTRTAYTHLYEEHTLRQLISLLETFSWDLQQNLTPLPTLCRRAGQERNNILTKIFSQLATELEAQIRPDVYHCMLAVLAKTKHVPIHTRSVLEQLGRSLGRFDLEGQLSGLSSVRSNCIRILEMLNKNRDLRLRGYQTLALCAGAALVILFI